MSKTIYLEGGGDSKELHARCREGFRKLLERCGFQGRMPRLVACGGRQATFEDFQTAHGRRDVSDFVAMLIDSEETPVAPLSPWQHLRDRDAWTRPADAVDDQVLLMVTCMETWIMTDRAALDDHYGNKLQKSALPPSTNPEKLSRERRPGEAHPRDSQLLQRLPKRQAFFRSACQTRSGSAEEASQKLRPVV